MPILSCNAGVPGSWLWTEALAQPRITDGAQQQHITSSTLGTTIFPPLQVSCMHRVFFLRIW